MSNDRILYGAIVGTVGALVQNSFAYIAKVLGFQGPLYTDYGRIILFYHDYRGALATGLGLVGHLIWDIIIGIVFMYLVKNTANRFYLLQGVLYGAMVWFLIKAGSTLFKIPVVSSVLPTTVAFFFVGSVLYGLAVSYSLHLIEHRRVN